jgi:tRNA (guanine10-N2)-methyltransferase
MLKPNGRLVFFLPTVTDEYEAIDVDTMLCDGMQIVANSLQDFGSWGRRVSFGIPSVTQRVTSANPAGNHTEDDDGAVSNAFV